MKCFVHREVDAVGLCKNCGKALCPDCLVDAPQGLSCRGHCEERTAAFARVIEQSRKTPERMRKMFRWLAAGIVVLGLILIQIGAVVEYQQHAPVFFPTLLMSSLIFVLALICYLLSFMYGKERGDGWG